jgi:hypothetical protein
MKRRGCQEGRRAEGKADRQEASTDQISDGDGSHSEQDDQESISHVELRVRDCPGPIGVSVGDDVGNRVEMQTARQREVMSEEVIDEVGENARIDEKRSVVEEVRIEVTGLDDVECRGCGLWLVPIMQIGHAEPGLHAAEHESGRQYQQQ